MDLQSIPDYELRDSFILDSGKLRFVAANQSSSPDLETGTAIVQQRRKAELAYSGFPYIPTLNKRVVGSINCIPA